MQAFVGILLLVFLVLVVGTVSSRLLGIRLGPWRRIAVGVIGWFVGLVATAYVLGDETTGGGRTLEPSDSGSGSSPCPSSCSSACSPRCPRRSLSSSSCAARPTGLAGDGDACSCIRSGRRERRSRRTRGSARSSATPAGRS